MTDRAEPGLFLCSSLRSGGGGTVGRDSREGLAERRVSYAAVFGASIEFLLSRST